VEKNMDIRKTKAIVIPAAVIALGAMQAMSHGIQPLFS